VRIAFVFAPYRHKAFEENVTIVDEEFGRFPPINLAYAAAIAENAGHEVMLLDANALELSPAEAVERLAAFGPDLLGCYLSTYMVRDTLDFVRAIRRELYVPVIAGGINLLLYPQETMHHSIVDYGLAGHALHSLPRMLEAIAAKRLPEGIPGACYRRDGRVICEPPERGVDFADFPVPARHLLPNDRYYSFVSQRKPFTMMVTALGCPWDCSFCAIAPLPYSARPAAQVLEELEACVRLHGIREVDIFDADFPVNRARTVAICEGIIQAGWDLEWSCRSRIGSVDPELLQLMGRAGLRQIYYGIETPSPEALERMNKPLDAAQVEPILDATRAAGIRPLGFFMVGVPGETRASLRATIRHSRRLGLDFAQYSRTIAKPGTKLYAEQLRVTGLDYWRGWVLGTAPERRMGSHWTELGEAEIELWTKLAYYTFYFRPGMLLRSLARVRSSEELERSARVAGRMLLSFLSLDRR
jgi:anaerobic magnesium-protoporphyrin IX monomethyl ester cyclase